MVLCVPAADLAKKKSLTVVIFSETPQSAEAEEAVAVYTVPMPDPIDQATKPYTSLGLSVIVGNSGIDILHSITPLPSHRFHVYVI